MSGYSQFKAGGKQLTLGVLLGWGAAGHGWMVLLAYSRRRKLLQRYAEEGISVHGRWNTENIQREPFCFRYQGRLTYTIPWENASSGRRMVVKEVEWTQPWWSSMSSIPRQQVSVLILPDLPLSGVLQTEVDRRDWDYGIFVRSIHIILSLIGVMLGAIWTAVPMLVFFRVDVSMAVWALVYCILGAPFACCHDSWERRTLRAGNIRRRPSRNERRRTQRQRGANSYAPLETEPADDVEEEESDCGLVQQQV